MSLSMLVMVLWESELMVMLTMGMALMVVLMIVMMMMMGRCKNQYLFEH